MKLHLTKKIVLIILLFSLSTAYSQNQPLSMNDLVNYSQFIVKAKLTKMVSYIGANNRIYSDIKYIVSKVYKGKIKTGEEVNFTFMGGSIGNRKTMVLESPVFETDIESILFLNYIQNTDSYYIYNLADGKYDIKNNSDNREIILRDLHSSHPLIINTTSGNKIIDNRNSIYLDDFQYNLKNLIE